MAPMRSQERPPLVSLLEMQAAGLQGPRRAAMLFGLRLYSGNSETN